MKEVISVTGLDRSGVVDRTETSSITISGRRIFVVEGTKTTLISIEQKEDT